MNDVADTAKRPLDALATRMPGRVVRPGDKDYDAARTIFYGGHDKRPAAVVRVKNAGEVAEVVTLARTSGLPLAVKCGGHSNAGHSTVDGGIVIDLARMKALAID